MNTLIGKDDGIIHLNKCTTLYEADHGMNRVVQRACMDDVNLSLRGQVAKG